MWHILQDTFFEIFDLYNVDIIASKKVSERELLIKKRERKEITSELRTYLKNVCNYLNNIKGYITDNEIRFLLECIDNRRYHITSEMVEELSCYVENDMQDEFVEKRNGE